MKKLITWTRRWTLRLRRLIARSIFLPLDLWCHTFPRLIPPLAGWVAATLAALGSVDPILNLLRLFDAPEWITLKNADSFWDPVGHLIWGLVLGAVVFACGFFAINYLARGRYVLGRWFKRSPFVSHLPRLINLRSPDERFEMIPAALNLADFLVCKMPAHLLSGLEFSPDSAIPSQASIRPFKNRPIEGFADHNTRAFRKTPHPNSFVKHIDLLMEARQAPEAEKIFHYLFVQTLIEDAHTVAWKLAIWQTSIAEITELTEFLNKIGKDQPATFQNLTEVDVAVLRHYAFWLRNLYPRLSEDDLLLVYVDKEKDTVTPDFQNACVKLLTAFWHFCGEGGTVAEGRCAAKADVAQRLNSFVTGQRKKKASAAITNPDDLRDVHFVCRRSGELYMVHSSSAHASRFFDKCQIGYLRKHHWGRGWTAVSFFEKKLNCPSVRLRVARVFQWNGG